MSYFIEITKENTFKKIDIVNTNLADVFKISRKTLENSQILTGLIIYWKGERIVALKKNLQDIIVFDDLTKEQEDLFDNMYK